MDFQTAWAIARETAPEYHHNACSFNVTSGGMLCDCDVLTKHPSYLAEPAEATSNEDAPGLDAGADAPTPVGAERTDAP